MTTDRLASIQDAIITDCKATGKKVRVTYEEIGDVAGGENKSTVCRWTTGEREMSLSNLILLLWSLLP